MDLKQYYNEWYEHGYMDEWPDWKKERVFDIIRSMDLPVKGKALDFGCGNGVFTQVIKNALPEWEVYGSDLSTLAVENAGKRFPACHFIYGEGPELKQQQFDLLFSHHVLEHVEDVPGTAAIISGMAASGASMLHILPCGNPGSLEYKLSSWTKNGIRPGKGNTFFFEEEMHLQRMTSAELETCFASHGFSKVAALYANQFYGALEWISAMPKQMIQSIADPGNATGLGAGLKLRYYRSFFIALYYLQRPFSLYGKQQDKANLPAWKKAVLYFSSAVKNRMTRMAEKEWIKHKDNEKGSEMYLVFKKNN